MAQAARTYCHQESSGNPDFSLYTGILGLAHALALTSNTAVMEHKATWLFKKGGQAYQHSMQGTVLIRNAEELQGYSKSEEDKLEGIIKGIADTGVQVVVAGSAFGVMALHFIEKYKMMAVRIPSKFDLRRFCRRVMHRTPCHSLLRLP